MISHPRLTWCLALFVLLRLGFPGVEPSSAKAHAFGQEKGKTLHILAIGINRYRSYKVGKPLQFAAKDARDFTSSLEGVARGTFARVTTHLLLDEDATRAGISLAVEEVMAQAKPQDTFVFFYSGQGQTRTLGPKKEEQFYLLPSDFQESSGSSDLYDMAVSGGLLQSWFLKIAAQHQLIVLNSSKSGRGFEGFIARTDEDNKFLGSVARRDFALVFINGASYEIAKLENGLLTHLLLEGLKGGATSDGGVFMARKLIEYVEQNSRQLIQQAGATTQRLWTRLNKSGLPASYFSGDDFPLGVRRGGEAGPLDQTRLRQAWFMKTVKVLGSPNRVRAAHASSGRPGGALPGTARTEPQGEDETYILKPECAALSEFHPSTSGSRSGKDHALLFGINEYDKFEKWPPLNNPVFDATSIAEVLNTRFGFETEVVKNPDKKCFGDFLGKYATKKYGDDEQLFIFFAGHGIYKSNVDGFLIVKDSEGVDPLGESFVSQGLLTRFINAIPCKHIFLVLDSCFGGAMAANRGAVGIQESAPADSHDGGAAAGSDDELVTTLMQYQTRRFLTSGGVEYVSDGLPGHHSPFANKFLGSFDLSHAERMFITLSDIIPVVKYKIPPVSPVPLFDSWYSNDSRSDFFFFFSITSSVNAVSGEAFQVNSNLNGRDLPIPPPPHPLAH
jgi:hypothetical protein